MTEFLPRSAWTDDPYPSGATMLVESEVEGVALHWPGSGGSISADKAAVIGLLRGELAFHTRPVSQGGRGWSDIAYNVAADQAGRVWDLRGITRRSAANGDVDVNRRFVAVTCLVGAKDTPTPALLQAIRDVRRKVLARYLKAKKVVPHSAIRPEPTDCPGDALRAHIAAGMFTRATDVVIAPPAPAPHLEDEDMKVIRTSDGRQWITNGPFSAPLASTEVAGAWCRLTGQLDDDGNPKAADVPFVLPASTTSTATLTLIQTLAAQAAANDPDVDVTALAASLAPLLHSDVDTAAVAEQIAAAVDDDLAQHLVDVLAARLQA